MANKIKSILDEESQDETKGEVMTIGKNARDTAHKFNPELRKKIVEAAKTKAVGFCGVDKSEAKTPPDESGNNAISFDSLTGFSFVGTKVRIYTPQKEVFWFCSADVCTILGYKNPIQAMQDHCLAESMKYKPKDATKPIHYICEKDLYSLILRSSKPNARPFREWVTEKVLPSLRRIGNYHVRTLDMSDLPPSQPEPPPAEGEQLEIFPKLMKLNLKNNATLYNILSNCRSYLKDKGTTFPTHEDYFKYLLQKGLEKVGFEGAEEN